MNKIQKIIMVMAVFLTLSMTGIGQVAAEEEDKGNPLFKIGLRAGTEQARMDLGLQEDELTSKGLWAEHPFYLEGFERGYSRTMNMLG